MRDIIHRAGLVGAAVNDRQRAEVGDGVLIRRVGDRVAAKVKRDGLARGDDDALRHAVLKRDGRAIRCRVDLILQRGICNVGARRRADARSGVFQNEVDAVKAYAALRRDGGGKLLRGARIGIIHRDVFKRERGVCACRNERAFGLAHHGARARFAAVNDFERGAVTQLKAAHRAARNDLERITVQIDRQLVTVVAGHQVQVPVGSVARNSVLLRKVEQNIAAQRDGRAYPVLPRGVDRIDQLLRQVDKTVLGSTDIVLRFVLRVRIPCGHAHAQKRCQNERKKRRQQRCKTFLSCLCHKFPPVFCPNPIDRFSPLRTCRRARAKNVNSIAIFSHIKYNSPP